MFASTTHIWPGGADVQRLPSAVRVRMPRFPEHAQSAWENSGREFQGKIPLLRFFAEAEVGGLERIRGEGAELEVQYKYGAKPPKGPGCGCLGGGWTRQVPQDIGDRLFSPSGWGTWGFHCLTLGAPDVERRRGAWEVRASGTIRFRFWFKICGDQVPGDFGEVCVCACVRVTLTVCMSVSVCLCLSCLLGGGQYKFFFFYFFGQSYTMKRLCILYKPMHRNVAFACGFQFVTPP